MKPLSVTHTDDAYALAAKALAEPLGLPISRQLCDGLLLNAKGLWLCIHPFKAMQVDFSYAHWRDRQAQGKRQALIQATKIKPGMRGIDATAGWGRDAALMAVFGAQVTLLERNPLMQALLADGLRRQTPLDENHLNLKLEPIEAKAFIAAMTTPVDVIYIDPMHPSRTKSALVKKDLQLLQGIIDPGDDAKSLIHTALASQAKRVVVKWPVSQPALLPPSMSLAGKTVRYDIYLAKY